MPHRCVILFLVALFSLKAAAAEGETELLNAARDAFRDRFYKRAEDQFAEFTTKFPASTNVPEAVLYRAQAQHFQKEYDGAIGLLRTNLPKAGPLADQYVLTWADALAGKGEHANAAEQYARLLKEFPTSPLRLQAAYLQANSYFQLKDFARTIELLRNPAGDFQKLAAPNRQERFAFAGDVLLAESLLAAGQVADARNIATAANAPADKPELQWEKFDLLARIELTSPTPQAALAFVTNAVTAGEAAQRPRLQAQSWNLAAEVYRRLGQTNNAVAVYEKIAGIESLPVDQRRLAMLKAVEFLSTSGNITNAIGRLEQYLNSTTNEPAADLLRVKAAELWIEQFRILTGSTRPVPVAAATQATNALTQARAHLSVVINQYTNSTHLGRAWLNSGWTLWEEGIVFNRPGRLQESATAFRTAAEKLTRSDDQALAWFKLADAQLYLNEPANAVTNYVLVLKNYGDLPQVKNALFDKTYAQLVRANLELGDMKAAHEYLAELRQAFPNSPLTDESLYLVGQTLATQGKAKEARTIFQDFITNYPSSPRIAEARFAEARTHALEGDNGTALQKHEQWLASYTNQLRPQVEFQRAVLLDKLAQSTNALAAFSQFVAKYPANPLAAAAQTWVADHFYTLQQWPQAEQNYQRVFQNTNWAGTRLAYEARLAAAKTAFRRQAYNDARSYLTNLVNDARCPADIQPRAWFALGDVFMEEPIVGNTNAVQNFISAAAVFDRITNQFSTNVISVLALARKGDCYFQLGSLTNYQNSYVIASNAYASVLNSRMTNVPVKVFNQAEFGLALVLERIAEGKTGAEREKLLEAALNHLLNIVYGQSSNGSGADPYYLKEAGKAAGRLAESLGNTEAAIQLYKRLSETAPSLKAMWENRITMLQSTREQNTILQ